VYLPGLCGRGLYNHMMPNQPGRLLETFLPRCAAAGYAGRPFTAALLKGDAIPDASARRCGEGAWSLHRAYGQRLKAQTARRAEAFAHELE